MDKSLWVGNLAVFVFPLRGTSANLSTIRSGDMSGRIMVRFSRWSLFALLHFDNCQLDQAAINSLSLIFLEYIHLLCLNEKSGER